LHELDMFIQQLHYEIARANYGLWWPPNPLCGWSVVLPRGERKGTTKISWDRCGLFLKLWLSLISHGPARSLALWQCCCMWAPKSLKVLCPSSNIMYINYSWIFLVLFWQKIEVFFWKMETMAGYHHLPDHIHIDVDRGRQNTTQSQHFGAAVARPETLDCCLYSPVAL
jgi:hypothetical protein